MIEILLRFLARRVLAMPPPWLKVVLLVTAVLVYGTTGFVYFELPGNPDLTWGDGFWYSLVTMATVGYGDLFPKTAGGRYLVGVPLMVIGIGILGYLLSLIASALLAARNKELQGMSSFRLDNHLIIINFPSLAKVERLLAELRRDRRIRASDPVVVIDEHLTHLPAELARSDVHFVRGDPSRDDTLSRASIDRARHVVILARRPGDPASDHLNLAIAVAIEGRARHVRTVTECVDPGSETLLRKAGVDHVVCVANFEALFLSQELVNPGMNAVLDDLASNQGGQQLYITPLKLTRTGSYSDTTGPCGENGHLPIGIRRGGQTVLNPPRDSALADGDQLVSIGPQPLGMLEI